MVAGDRSRTRLSGSRILVLLCVAACPLSQASATAVPAAQYNITLNNGTPITTPGSFSQGDATGEIENLPSPLLIAHVGGAGTGFVQLLYYFRVHGPAANLPVPIQIAGNVHISAGNAVFAQDEIWGLTAQVNAQALDGPLGPGVGEVDSAFSTVDCSPTSEGPIPTPPPIPSCSASVQDQAVLLTLNTLSGADNRISLVASANNMEAFTADFDAQVDPVISFAPGFDATGYSLELSDGVGNAVPEPSAALMTGTGIGLRALLRRGKRRPPRCR